MVMGYRQDCQPVRGFPFNCSLYNVLLFASMGLSAALSFDSLLILCSPYSFTSTLIDFSLCVCIENFASPLIEVEIVLMLFFEVV